MRAQNPTTVEYGRLWDSGRLAHRLAHVPLAHVPLYRTSWPWASTMIARPTQSEDSR